MRRGPWLEPITLTAEENNQLVEWTRRHKTSQALAMRARVVLASQQDRSNREIAEQLRVTPQTVGKWRTRFMSKRLDGLLDEQQLCRLETLGRHGSQPVRETPGVGIAATGDLSRQLGVGL